MLCEDEIARRDATAIVRRVRQARFEQHVTLEDFDFSYNPKIPAAHFRDLATLRFVTANEAVILHGPVGVGKTHLAQALAHQACRRGHSAAFTKTSRLLADLAGGHADRTWGARLRRWAKPDVLVLDDFAMRDFTAVQADDLYELITERHNHGSLILTSNRAPVDWYPLFPNPVVAESVLDPTHQHRAPPPPRRQQLPTQQTTRQLTRAERSRPRLEHPRNRLREYLNEPAVNNGGVDNRATSSGQPAGVSPVRGDARVPGSWLLTSVERSASKRSDDTL